MMYSQLPGSLTSRYEIEISAPPDIDTAEIEDWVIFCLDHLRAPRQTVSVVVADSYLPLASASRGRINLSTDLFSGVSRRHNWRTVIAHELAHVTQFETKRRGGLSSDTIEIEKEATAAASIIQRGGYFSCYCHVDEDHRPNWNRFGHYYTILVLCLAAGWPYSLAEQVAYMAQVPDLALELDAPTQSITGLGLYISRNYPGLQERFTRSFVRHFPVVGTKDEYELPDDYEASAKIGIGLHSLTGRSTSAERSFRHDKLSKVDPNSYEFGLALHALGDSYAHCESGMMYTPLLGHALQQHDPDCTFEHQENYTKYLAGAWDAIWSVPQKLGVTNADFKPAWPHPRNLGDVSNEYKKSSLGRIMRMLGLRAGIPETDAHEVETIKSIRNFINSNWAGCSMQEPAYDGVPFAKLSNYYLCANLQQCLQTAYRWADEIPEGLKSAKRELESDEVKQKVRHKISGLPVDLAIYFNGWLSNKVNSALIR
jgi:hypothetical protein